MKKQLYINGEWRDSANYAELLSPYTNKVIAQIPQASKEEVEETIEMAHQKEQRWLV